MSGMRNYLCAGYSPRLGTWLTETYECATMEAAKHRFLLQYPTLKNIKVYPLRPMSEVFE